MKAHLLFPDRDLDRAVGLPTNAEDLVQDLGLDLVVAAMSRSDPLLDQVGRAVLLQPVTDTATIAYRQAVLRDCLERPDMVREIYALAGDAIEAEHRVMGSFFRDPDAILRRALDVLHVFLPPLRRLRELADAQLPTCRSEGMRRFFQNLAADLDDEFFRSVEGEIEQLGFRPELLISAGLDRGMRPARHVLRQPGPVRESLLERLFSRERYALTYQIPERDENGARALADLRNHGVDLVSNAVAQSVDHIRSFFGMLRVELGFYLGCLNLDGELRGRGHATCWPCPDPETQAAFSCTELYDVALALALDGQVVGNTVEADGRALVAITGANRGGKSTFLRSVGQAVLMAQAGMFVGAGAFRCQPCDRLFTHYRREEDASITHGKLDEELSRMSTIVDQVSSRSILLCNESFASTNEREGSEIARQVVDALLEAGVRVFFVTHMYDLASGWYAHLGDAAAFLRAERDEDGRRSFRLLPGQPLTTSFGEDLYAAVFGSKAG